MILYKFIQSLLCACIETKLNYDFSLILPKLRKPTSTCHQARLIFVSNAVWTISEFLQTLLNWINA